MTPEAGRQACASMPCHDPKVRRALQAPGSWQNPTDTQQIKHAVDVLERFCRQGLIVVYADHREVAGVWFQAGCPPTKVTADVAQQLARQERWAALHAVYKRSRCNAWPLRRPDSQAGACNAQSYGLPYERVRYTCASLCGRDGVGNAKPTPTTTSQTGRFSACY